MATALQPMKMTLGALISLAASVVVIWALVVLSIATWRKDQKNQFDTVDHTGLWMIRIAVFLGWAGYLGAGVALIKTANRSLQARGGYSRASVSF